MKPRSFLAFALIAISGCAYYDRCLYEIRSLQASGRAIENGVELMAVQLTLPDKLLRYRWQPGDNRAGDGDAEARLGKAELLV